MNFKRFFNMVSYSVVASGALSLWATGGIGLLSAAAFAVGAAVAWRQEEGGWQMSERLGTLLVVLALPLSYFGWKFGVFSAGPNDSALAGLLGQLILVLSIIKLLQKKTDRDWVFLYLMSFFEVLLSAGITISPLYLLCLVIYLVTVVCAIIAFEIKRSASKIGKDLLSVKEIGRTRLPSSAVAIAVMIVSVAAPMFFLLPRVGGAGLMSSADGLTTRTGFSDSVRLGEIGRIQQSDQIVMRVRVEEGDSDAPLRWRGVALDLFDNVNWRSSKPYTDPPFTKLDRDYFLVNFASGKGPLVTQTIYLEPLDSPVLFALGRPIAVSGSFDLLFKNSDDNLKFPRRSFERLSYRVSSDPYVPPAERLKADSGAYPVSASRFLQMPDGADSRIAALAAEVVERAGARSRYEKAQAIEAHLKNNFGYTLEMKAGGGQPVADFLFNVREGHCEYFASAMVLMLRTQGIAARVVNGFQRGEYNGTAGVYVVRQRDAHSWVEALLPGEGVWVTFDPTPSSGQASYGSSGILGGVTKYLEALETFWIQYFVSYDNQEQKSLFRSMKSGFNDYQVRLSEVSSGLQDRLQLLWARLRGDEGAMASIKILLVLLGSIALAAGLWFGGRRYGPAMMRHPLLARLRLWLAGRERRMVIDFYERMVATLERSGRRRRTSQTPLEFALALDMPEAVRITEKYNAVRFGEAVMTREERNAIEVWLRRLENGAGTGSKEAL